MFDAIVLSNGCDDATAALQLLSHLEGDALNVALLVPESGESTNVRRGPFHFALETLAINAAWISSRTRPQEPGIGEAQIIASRDGATAWPMAQPTPMSQTVLKQPETVVVSAVLVEATPERSDRILSSVSHSVMVMSEEFQPDDGTRSESCLLWEAGGVLHVWMDGLCWGGGGGGRCGDVSGRFC